MNQLEGMIEELRRLQSPFDAGVTNLDGGALWDCRLPGSSDFYGPFDTVQDFHKHLREDTEARPGLLPEVEQLISQHD